MLTTRDLERKMAHDVTFAGVFPINRLPIYLLPKPCGLIINQDEHYKPGSHWVAVKLEKYKPAYYFDSFGSYPRKEIISFMEQNSKSWVYNKKKYQSDLSSLCGYYCLLFLIYGPEKFNTKMRECNYEHNQLQIKRIY